MAWAWGCRRDREPSMSLVSWGVRGPVPALLTGSPAERAAPVYLFLRAVAPGSSMAPADSQLVLFPSVSLRKGEAPLLF